ncbi:hypothetical protein FRC09_011958 [Ceratobasidium sp. 395]|nr:hypothetical protein FRC09_011958 [Ceratobasidium sp. 395]
MPKASFRDVQAALLENYGISVRLGDDGSLDIREKAGQGGGGITRKRPIKLHACSDPGGSVGRNGFNLQEKMHLSDADYKLVCSSAKVVINKTHGLNPDLSFLKQDSHVIDLCIQKLTIMHPELHAYDEHNRWAPRAFFMKFLRTSSGKANAAKKLEQELAKVEMAVKQQESNGQEAIPQNEVAPETGPKEQAGASTEKAAKKRGRPKKIRLPEPEIQPAPDSAPAGAAPFVHEGAPAIVASQSPSSVIMEPNAPAPPAPTGPVLPSQPALNGVPTDAAQPGPAAPCDNANDGEVDDMGLDLGEVDVLDTTMNSFHHLSLGNANKEPGDSTEDDDDNGGGEFDMRLAMGNPVEKPGFNSVVESTVERAETAIELIVERVETAVEPIVERTEPNATSGGASPTSSALAPNPNPIILNSSSPSPEAPSGSPVLPTDPTPVLRSSLRQRGVKGDPAVSPAPPVNLNAATSEGSAAADMPLDSSKLTPTTPFICTPTAAADSDIIWRGNLISHAEMVAIRSAAAHQAKGGKPLRIVPMFDELIVLFVANPEYDPSSDPHPPPKPPAPVGGRRRGRAAAATTVVTGPSISVEAAPVAKDLKAQPKPKPKAKPKMKPVLEPEPEHTAEPGPEPAGDDHTVANTIPADNNADDMQLETPIDEGTGGKKSKGRQQTAKGGAKLANKAAATEGKAPKAANGQKAPAVPLRTSTRTTRSSVTK